jgi:N-acetyl-anhydromuramyl-L-alanine amidase AmpD
MALRSLHWKQKEVIIEWGGVVVKKGRPVTGYCEIAVQYYDVERLFRRKIASGIISPWNHLSELLAS